jgi:hypothetical protein
MFNTGVVGGVVVVLVLEMGEPGGRLSRGGGSGGGSLSGEPLFDDFLSP